MREYNRYVVIKMAFKIRLSSLSEQEREERYQKTLQAIDVTKGFVNLFVLFQTVNPDIDVNLFEFRNFVNNRKK